VYEDKLRAGVHVQNGAGELTGSLQIMEWGILETPIALTNTLNVGLVHDAIVDHMLKENKEVGDRDEVFLPVVGECDDSYLNDIRGRHVKLEHVLKAIQAADSRVTEGSVGAGTGMSAMGFKAGVGTASRKLTEDLGQYILGSLVVANFGIDRDLRVDGVPIGQELQIDRSTSSNDGSIITVIATSAPTNTSQLRRLAARVPLALGKVGSISSNSSGDITIAFSTAEMIPAREASLSKTAPEVGPKVLNALFRATVEATEEAILNSIFVSETMKGRDDNMSRGLPIDETLEIMKRHGRL
jgi:D-aminopeptidase